MAGENDFGGNAGENAGATPPPPPPPGYTPYTPGDQPAAGQWSADPYQQAPKKRGFPKKLVGIVAAVVVFGGIGAVRNYIRDNKDPFNRPQTIGNATLLTDPEMEKIATEARKDVDNVHRPVSGFYAVNGAPAFLMVAGDADDDSGDSLYKTFAKSARKDGTQVGESKKVGKVVCASINSEDIPGVACFWGSGKSDGVILHFGTQDLNEAGQVAQQAWDAVETKV